MEDYNQRLLKSLEKKAHRLRSESNDGSGCGTFTPKLERIRESLSKTSKVVAVTKGGDKRGKSHQRKKSSQAVTPDRRVLREMYNVFKDKRDEMLRKQTLI
jgi:hypothetical protein